MFEGITYTSTDGKFSFDLGQLHNNTWANAIVKVLDHVTGNEAISKGSTAKSKAGVVGDAYTEQFTQAMYDDIIANARQGYLESMIAGTWGEKGTRAPRTPGATRLETIFNSICADDVRKKLAADGRKKSDSDDNAWCTEDGVAHPLSVWMKAYLDNEKFGEDRKASITFRAQAKLDAELKAAEQRKADKAREAGESKAAGLSI